MNKKVLLLVIVSSMMILPIKMWADGLDSEEEKEELKKLNEESKDMFEVMKKAIDESYNANSGENISGGMEHNQIKGIRFTHRLKKHPVCLTSEGILSVEMEKVLNSMPNNRDVKAEIVLEINEKHPISEKLKSLYVENKEDLKKYAQILYSQARLIEGLPVENPTELSNLICKIMTK